MYLRSKPNEEFENLKFGLKRKILDSESQNILKIAGLIKGFEADGTPILYSSQFDKQTQLLTLGFNYDPYKTTIDDKLLRLLSNDKIKWPTYRIDSGEYEFAGHHVIQEAANHANGRNYAVQNDGRKLDFQ